MTPDPHLHYCPSCQVKWFCKNTACELPRFACKLCMRTTCIKNDKKKARGEAPKETPP